MVSIETVRKLALAFEGAEELPHFELISFRIKKKIFATVNIKMNRVCLRLPELEQSIFTSFDSNIVYPVPNAWGKQGWTLFHLNKIRKSMIVDALTIAYCKVAPAKLAEKYQDK